MKRQVEKKHEDHSMSIKSTLKIINWPYQIMADRVSMLSQWKKHTSSGT